MSLTEHIKKCIEECKTCGQVTAKSEGEVYALKMAEYLDENGAGGGETYATKEYVDEMLGVIENGSY